MNIDTACFEKFAMILVGTSVAGAGVAGVALPNGVIESLAGGFGLWAKAKQDANVTATQVVRRMTTELQREWQTWGAALSSHANDGIRANALASFQEVVPLCALLPQDVVGQRLSPEAVAALFLAKAAQVLPSVYANPDPRNPETHLARQFLLRITTRAYAHLVAEPGYIAQIAPALWQAALEVQARIEAKVDLLVEQLRDTSRQLGLAEGTVIGIAKAFATDVEDFDTALRELTRAVGIAARFERQGSLPARTGDQITAVMAEVARLNRSQNFAEAATVIADSYDRIEAERARLIEVGLEQAILSRNAPDAAKWALYKVKLPAQVPDLFNALRYERQCWYVSGRDKGIAFDLQVAIAIAQSSRDMATSPDQRGVALNDLGTALQILGERETGTARLMEAVAAYYEALQVRTRAELGHDAEQSGQCAQNPRGARNGYRTAVGSRGGLSRRLAGIQARTRTAELGRDAEQSRLCAPNPRGARNGYRASVGGRGGLSRRLAGANARPRAAGLGWVLGQFGLDHGCAGAQNE